MTGPLGAPRVPDAPTLPLGAPRDMAVERNTQALDALNAFVRQIGGTLTLQVEGLGDDDRVKLRSLQATGRPFLAVTPQVKADAADALRAALARVIDARGRVRADEAGALLGEEFKRRVILRFTEQGADVTLRPLDPEYLRMKRRHGLDPRIGIATGTLLRSLRAARFRFVRGL